MTTFSEESFVNIIKEYCSANKDSWKGLHGNMFHRDIGRDLFVEHVPSVVSKVETFPWRLLEKVFTTDFYGNLSNHNEVNLCRNERRFVLIGAEK